MDPPEGVPKEAWHLQPTPAELPKQFPATLPGSTPSETAQADIVPGDDVVADAHAGQKQIVPPAQVGPSFLIRSPAFISLRWA